MSRSTIQSGCQEKVGNQFKAKLGCEWLTTFAKRYPVTDGTISGCSMGCPLWLKAESCVVRIDHNKSRIIFHFCKKVDALGQVYWQCTDLEPGCCADLHRITAEVALEVAARVTTPAFCADGASELVSGVSLHWNGRGAT